MSLKEIPIHSYYNQTRRCYQKTPDSLPSSSKALIPMVSLKDVEALIRNDFTGSATALRKHLLGEDDEVKE